MGRDRLKEIVDFARAESPYRSANKGWITDDVYLQLGKSFDKRSLRGEELVDVSIYWKPISQVLSVLFIVISFALVLVVSSSTLAKGELRLPAITNLQPIQEKVVSKDVKDIEIIDNPEDLIPFEDQLEFPVGSNELETSLKNVTSIGERQLGTPSQTEGSSKSNLI